MSLIPMELMLVLRRFPERQAEINRIFRENDAFRAICRDYGLCNQALQRWNQSDVEEAEERRVEYTELMEELESEILENLDE
jgi:hypothetical protein